MYHLILGKRQQRVLVTVDRRTGLLYSIGDTESMNLLGTCSLDPHTLPFGKNHLESNIYSLADKYSKVDSLSVDEKTIMLGIQKVINHKMFFLSLKELHFNS